ncbi:MAG TPA: winged helix-turn-helix transcriptional regulator [Nitrososphaeraceae archaeon]|nr:winged helix-turn-helix transcriptional regulator [Nitrososphaeraceae archaeon]
MQLQRQFLDEKDLEIISILSKDCRASFMSIGSTVGMTSKSVKARVDTMISTGVIEKFVVKVNPVSLGYGMSCMLIVREHTAHTDDIVSRLNLLGDVSIHSKCMGGISTFCLAIKEGHEDKLELLRDSLKPATVHFMFTSPSSYVSNKHELSESDLQIIKCLLSNPRMDMNDIAKKISISARTVNRRLTRLKDNNVLKFFILCNPVSTLGYIQFVLVINTVDKSFNNQIIERMYGELKENILCQPPIIDPDNIITLLLFSQDIYTADGILKEVESFTGVNRVELFILTDTTSYDEWVLKEIDKRLNSKSTRRQKQELEDVIKVSS